jgi:hypothetical protein
MRLARFNIQTVIVSKRFSSASDPDGGLGSGVGRPREPHPAHPDRILSPVAATAVLVPDGLDDPVPSRIWTEASPPAGVLLIIALMMAYIDTPAIAL